MNSFDGKKVKINVDAIINNKLSKSKKFLTFINKHKNDVFTAHDTGNGTKFTGILYELIEDNSPIKWLFYQGDLILVGDDIFEENFRN